MRLAFVKWAKVCLDWGSDLLGSSSGKFALLLLPPATSNNHPLPEDGGGFGDLSALKRSTRVIQMVFGSRFFKSATGSMGTMLVCMDPQTGSGRNSKATPSFAFVYFDLLGLFDATGPLSAWGSGMRFCRYLPRKEKTTIAPLNRLQFRLLA